MAIKIRCSECNKKVSIDEAFAGGMCRCPYCKALVYVPEASGKAAAGARPAAPVGRPSAPESRADGADAAADALGAQAAMAGEGEGAVEHEHVPMAQPVKLQGIITLVLLGLLLLMVAAGVFIALKYIPSGEPQLPPEDYEGATSPTVVKVGDNKAGVADVEFAAGPILYVIDGGSSMRNTLDHAGVLTRSSILSLGKAGLKFNVLLAREEENKVLGEDYRAGGQAGVDAALEFLTTVQASGATDIPKALTDALTRKPKVIVLVVSKPVSDAYEAAEAAKAQGVAIHTVEIWSDYPDPETSASLKKVAEITGGKHRSYGTGEF